MTATDFTVTDQRWRSSDDEAEAPADPPAAEQPDRPGMEPCSQCGAPLGVDQEWCLSCGSAKTLIYPPPDWRFAAGVVALVVVIALVGFGFALSRLSSGASHTAAAQLPTNAGSDAGAGAVIQVPGQTTKTTKPTATGTAGTANSAEVNGIASWPVGEDGWTVVLQRFTTESDAYVRARQIVPTGIATGVLNSSDHPSMKPGYWIVFSGRYPDKDEAQAATATLIKLGYTTAHARRVAPPGGL